jgi:hypothetical protein
VSLRDRWEDIRYSDWYSSLRYFLRYQMWGLSLPPPKPPKPMSPEAAAQMDSLIKALEIGGYDAAPGKLTQGQPLIVEDLSPVMRCVTFEDPGYFEQSALRMLRLRNVARLFRLRSLAHDFDQAALHFEDRAKKASIRFWGRDS